MPEATSPNLDPLAQLMAEKAPETVEDMRTLLDSFGGLLNANAPELGEIQESVSIREGVTADLLVPHGDGPHPVLVYLHGGGWICGSPRSHRKLASRFAEAGYLVVNVDYRLAPEHPFPTPFEDCLEAVRWTSKQIAGFGGDPERIAVGGDSAGANLSAAVAAALKGDAACPRAALLIYGVFDFATLGAAPAPAKGAAADPSMEVLGEKMVELMVGSYLGPAAERGSRLSDPRVSPLHAAADLPPCHVVVGSADPLMPQAEALVAALRRAGMEFEHFVDEGMPHGYAQMEFLPPALPAIERMLAFLRKHV